MPQGTFEIEASADHRCWAELDGSSVLIHRTPPAPLDSGHLLSLDTDALRNLLTWATQDGAVTAHFTGPMAKQVRDHSRELGMTPEMFVWHAVKVFIEVGTG